MSKENIFFLCDGSRLSSLMMVMMVVGVLSLTLGFDEES